jgi:hypothetical protein
MTTPNLQSTYVPRCRECVSANLETGMDGLTYRSCLHHIGRPQLLESGNAVTSNPFNSEVKLGKKKLADHKSKGAMVLLPGDLRDLRGALVGADLQRYQ